MGCGPHDAVTNPTGTCEPKDNAKDNGGRPKYHSPGPRDTYLPDCNAPLNREYWRVFVWDDNRAYVVPRMEAFAMARQYGMCAGDDLLSSLFNKYHLCKEDLEPADVEALNDIEPAEALNITNALHKRLCFQAQPTGSSWSITPWGPEDDIAGVCSTTTDAAVTSYCGEIKKFFECASSCDEGEIHASAEAIAVIVSELNNLYGTSRNCFPSPTVQEHSTARLQTDNRFMALLGLGAFLLVHRMHT